VILLHCGRICCLALKVLVDLQHRDLAEDAYAEFRLYGISCGRVDNLGDFQFLVKFSITSRYRINPLLWSGNRFDFSLRTGSSRSYAFGGPPIKHGKETGTKESLSGLLMIEDIIPSMRRYTLYCIHIRMRPLHWVIASGLLGSVYGTSNIVWASITLILSI
jgi:hypothetical protein